MHTHTASNLELVAHSDVPLVVNHLHEGQGVPLAALVIVVVMGRGDLHRPRTKCNINHLVSDDHKLPVTERMLALLANEILRTYGREKETKD